MSKEETVATCRADLRRHLGGHDLMSNAAHLRGSAVWMQLSPRDLRDVVSRERRADGRCGGDRAFLDRFGHRLAFDSAIALADYLHSEPTLEQRLRPLQDERRLEVLRLQSAARNSSNGSRRSSATSTCDPVQFAYSLLTRSAADQPREPAPARPRLAGGPRLVPDAGRRRRTPGRAPMFAPFRCATWSWNRVVVSPMAQYKAVDGCPTDWHLVHLGERAKGGAGLVYTEMTCVSPEGRITPGCPGLYAPEHEAAWKRLVDFVHAETDAKICCQIGHSGRKGSTQLGWEEMDAPAARATGRSWPLPHALVARNPVPREMTRADMDRVTANSWPRPRWPSAPGST
jgi:anthraniloyl-CoA monooxygenase